MKERETFNGTIDIAKFMMAILVVGIHTEPFGFNIWLDRGFGIVTRFCVPFFFAISSYFLFKKKHDMLNKECKNTPPDCIYIHILSGYSSYMQFGR